MCLYRIQHTYRKKKPLGGTRFKKSFPLLGIFTGKGDWIDGVVKLGTESHWPGLQLTKRTHNDHVKLNSIITLKKSSECVFSFLQRR